SPSIGTACTTRTVEFNARRFCSSPCPDPARIDSPNGGCLLPASVAGRRHQHPQLRAVEPLRESFNISCMRRHANTPEIQLQPEVLPQLGQAWQEPARCIWTPHCMQYGASLCWTGGWIAGVEAGGAGSVTPARSSRLGSFGALSVSASSGLDESMLGGSAGRSPRRVSVTVSSTPGSVGWVRSPVV